MLSEKGGNEFMCYSSGLNFIFYNLNSNVIDFAVKLSMFHSLKGHSSGLTREP